MFSLNPMIGENYSLITFANFKVNKSIYDIK